MTIRFLIQTFFKERLSVQRLFGRRIAESRVQKFFMLILILYALISTGGSIGLIHYELALTLVDTGNVSQLWLNVFSYYSGLAFIFAFFQAQGTLFQYKDFDLLGALPITQKSISTSKILVMLTVTHIFASIFVIPIVIVIAMFINLSIIQWVLFFLVALLLPIPMMMVGSFVSLGIRRLTQAWFHPQVMQTLMTIAFMIMLISFTYFQNQLMSSGWLSANVLMIIENFDITRLLFIAFMVDNHVLLGLVLLVLLLAISFAFIQLISMVSLRTNQQQTAMRFIAKETKPTKVRSLLSNLITKEWKRFIHSSIYVINTSFGLIMLVIVSLAAIFARSQIDAVLIELGITQDFILIAVTGFIVFTLVTVYTPAVSLSLEGKNFPLIKSLPLNYQTLFDAKIYFNVLLSMVPLLFAIILFSIAFNMHFFQGITIAMMMMIFSYSISVLDMWINVLFPRFDFQHEVEVVKQSMAALIAVLGGFGIFGAAIYLLAILLGLLSWYVSSAIVSTIVLSVGIALHFLLHRRANKIIQQMEV